MMTYDEAKSAVFARGTVPDGYFGDRMKCSFAFDEESGKILVVHDHGFYWTGLTASNEEEADWLLRKGRMRGAEITL